MAMNSISEKQILQSSLISRICGDVARGMNFGVMTCVSCKAFFRRNALRSLVRLRCAQKFNCKITKETRTNCAACRLKKCFVSNMKPQLIRSFNRYRILTPETLDLLRNDRSRLIPEEWNLLSNIFHVYNEHNAINRLKCSLDQGSSLPMKLRVKTSFALTCISNCFLSIEFLFKRSSPLHLFPIKTCRELVRYNAYATSNLNALFISREANMWDNSSFEISFTQLYGSDIFKKTAFINKQLDSNGILIKMMLFVMAFSSNNSIVIFNSLQNNENTSSSIDIIRIQDIFVTLLWKYLPYQYGFIESVLRCSSLIKTVLDLLSLLNEKRNVKEFVKMMDTLVQQTEHSLIIEN